jgi:hypothetical protein
MSLKEISLISVNEASAAATPSLSGLITASGWGRACFLRASELLSGRCIAASYMIYIGNVDTNHDTVSGSYHIVLTGIVFCYFTLIYATIL